MDAVTDDFIVATDGTFRRRVTESASERCQRPLLPASRARSCRRADASDRLSEWMGGLERATGGVGPAVWRSAPRPAQAAWWPVGSPLIRFGGPLAIIVVWIMAVMAVFSIRQRS